MSKQRIDASSMMLFCKRDRSSNNALCGMTVVEQNLEMLRKWDSLDQDQKFIFRGQKEWAFDPKREEKSIQKYLTYKIKSREDPQPVNIPLLKFPSRTTVGKFLSSDSNSVSSILTARSALAYVLMKQSCDIPITDAFVSTHAKRRECERTNIAMGKRKIELKDFIKRNRTKVN